MYKKFTELVFRSRPGILSNILLKMKLTIVIVLAVFLQLEASTTSAQKISLKVENAPLKKVVALIRQQTDFDFLYNNISLKDLKPITLNVINEDLSSVLEQCFAGQPLKYTINRKTILITGKPAAQPGDRKITGRITDSKGQSLPGASVTVVGTNVSATTDADGRYEIRASDKDVVLRFTFIGFNTVEVEAKAGSKNIFDVVLEEKVNMLNELVVVGYGEQRKISNIGSQSSLKMKDIKTPSASLSTVLAGRLSGVVAVQRTGEPGKDGADIWIRGISTPNSSSPLVLVDGVERGFNDIDPEDIESLTVLKDASATAVYGVRGANGVILIKTKPGKIGKPTVSTDYYESITSFTKRVDLSNGITYMNAVNEALANSGQQPKYSQSVVNNTLNNVDPYLYPNVSWLDEIFNDWGHNRRANVNVRGGSANANYYASVSYYNETGLMKTDNIENYNSKINFNRYNFTTNLNLKVTESTSVDIGAQGYLGEGNYPAISSADIYSAAMEITPVDYPKMFYVNGKAYVPGLNPNGGYRNPYADATRRGFSNQTRNQIYSNLRVTQDLGALTPGLKLSGMFAYDVYNNVSINQGKRESTFYFANRDVPYDLDNQPILVQTYAGSDVLGFSQRSDDNNKKTYLEASLTYDRSFGKHRVGALALFNEQSRLLYPVGSLESSIPYRMMGVAGRATYSWDDRYFAEFNIGYNGSENFAPNKRFGTFPAFGIGWVPSNEKFWEPLKNVVSFLKIRYTDGKIGNSNVSDRRFMFLEQMEYNGDFGYNWGSNNGKTSGVKVNNNAVNIGWEESRKQDLGIDLKLMRDELSIIFDLFKEHRTDILLKRNESIPSFLGYMSDPYGNVGVVDNKGFDSSLEYNKRISANWSVSVRGNFTFNKDKWVDSDQPDQRYPWMNKAGSNLNARRGYIADGLYSQEEVDDIRRWESLNSSDRADILRPFPVQFAEVKAGDIKYKDLNGDGRIDAYDQSYIGRGDVPKMIYGFGFNTTYKQFSLGLLFQGVKDADRMLNGNSINPFRGDGGGGNLFSNIDDRWTIDNPAQDVFYPRLAYGSDQTSNINNFQTSTWWQKDVSFLRLKTMQISYNLPQRWIKRANLKNASVYMMGTNLFTLSKFKLWDPELNTNNGTKYPNISTYSMGVNFSF
ncbi:TonB-linked SusC/RagA family outer membrane protein [Arcticibacter tournemirensis]|nr:TonB-linked SusC/RagA family outer membrane protein [Arcticibacter tournemirensis]